MSETTQPTPVETSQVVATGSSEADARVAAATAFLNDANEVAPTEPAPESEDAAEGDAEAAEGDAKPKVEGAKEAKSKSGLREAAGEWATARRMQAANAKRQQELDVRHAALEGETATAREVATLMSKDPIAAVERLAALAGIQPHEYLQRLQLAYLGGDEARQESAASREVAELRAELHAERNARTEAAATQDYQQQVAEITTTETANLVELASAYANEFPSLQRLSEAALGRRMADAVAFYVARGEEVGRYEVLQAVDRIVKSTLDDYEISDRVVARGASSPAPNGGKRTGTPAASTRPRNGASRHIPTNAAAAESGAQRRALTPEERLAEATKILWSNG
jgi:uncharacterized protein YjbJ (UPF0337 family)